jgi:hypothetical protein
MIYDDDMRTIVEIPDHQLAAVAAACRREGISRAELVRRAVAAYTRRGEPSDAGDAFGLWRDRDEDGLAYQARLRAEWP